MPSSQKLEPEDEDSRQKRIVSLLAKTDSSIERASSSTNAPVLPLGKDQLPPLPPSSNELLNRVKQFLPQLEAANQDIQDKLAEDPKSLDIEVLNEDTENYIEMDLGLGVFKQKREGASSSSEDSEDSSSNDENHGEGNSSVNSSGSDSSSELEGEESKKERKIKPLPRRKEKGPLIVEMG